MALSQYAVEEIHRLVWSAFYDEDEIREIICEQYLEPDEEVDEAEVANAIEAEIRTKAAAERTWNGETDCDRLDRVFEELNAHGIIALQKAGWDQSEGLEDVTEVYDSLGWDESGVTGYCFYHEQDLDRVVDGAGLYLTYGDINGTDEKGVEIGRQIRDALEKEGFTVKWDGRIQTRLLIDPIDWKKRWKES